DSFKSPRPVCGRIIPMTSPSGKKNRTTRPDSAATSSRRGQGSGVGGQGRPAAAIDAGDISAICKLRFAISDLKVGAWLMAAAMSVTAVSTASASDLQWRHAKQGTKPAAAKAEAKPAEV